MTPTGSDTCCLVRPVCIFAIKLRVSLVYKSLSELRSPSCLPVRSEFVTVFDLYDGYQGSLMRNKYSDCNYRVNILLT